MNQAQKLLDILNDDTRYVKIIEEFEFNGIHYRVGDVFKVIGESGMRGLDIQDQDGNKIYETAMMAHKYELIR